jgi:hypothetical protein
MSTDNISTVYENEEFAPYVDSDNDSDSDSDSKRKSTNVCKIVLPNRKKEKGNELINLLLNEQTKNLVLSKKIYKLKSNIEINENKTRYIQLDLNTYVEKLKEEETKHKENNEKNILITKEEEKKLKNITYENYTMKALILLYLIITFYNLVMKLFS